MKKDNEQNIIQQLTIEEKLQLTTGDGCWKTATVERLEVKPVTVSDGPVGLRKEEYGQTLPAVCFPSVSKLACSFDPAVLREVGTAIGEQCRKEGVNVLLAPGLNIKRNPRCGRNFEYFSEDPFLTAELANAYIQGVNSQEVGVCVKHFAGNSQEYGRRVCDSVIDERALREIYLAAFERVIKASKPCAVMCAYNKLNGEYCSQNKRLLTEILRNEWKYEGVVMSDWGATDDRAKGISSGLDLQMPQGEINSVRKAFNSGLLWESDVNNSVSRILQLSQTFEMQQPRSADYDMQHELCRHISADCTVLLKNNCRLLPFDKTDTIALIGLFADEPNFQGGGSSKVTPYKVESIKQRLEQMGVAFRYCKGYTLEGTDELLLEEAQLVASQCNKVLLVVGNGGCESEGFDRTDWQLPECQRQVIDVVTSASSNVAVVLQCGSPVDVNWHHSCKALLLDYLGGESGGAIADVVFGVAQPCGRLAETWPHSLPKLDSEFSADYKRALYKESIFVGYRYYTTANVEVAFPFGYGLSYNEIKWRNVQVSNETVMPTGKITISLEVENRGKVGDADTVQVYLTNLDGRDFYAKKNLVAFKKVRLKGGEKKKVTISVDVADFASYNTSEKRFDVNGGRYILTVARNCIDEGFPFEITVVGDNNSVDNSERLECYYNVDESFSPADEQFEALYGQFPTETFVPFTRNSPLTETTSTWFGRQLAKLWTKGSGDKRTLLATPLIDFVQIRSFVSAEMVDTMVDMLNGAFFKNLFKLLMQYLRCKRKSKAAAQK